MADILSGIGTFDRDDLKGNESIFAVFIGLIRVRSLTESIFADLFN